MRSGEYYLGDSVHGRALPGECIHEGALQGGDVHREIIWGNVSTEEHYLGDGVSREHYCPYTCKCDLSKVLEQEVPVGCSPQATPHIVPPCWAAQDLCPLLFSLEHGGPCTCLVHGRRLLNHWPQSLREFPHSPAGLPPGSCDASLCLQPHPGPRG